tara:strand:+ start:3423 stop:3905 length:483 start_codon:yes stop_codon:yes gene_type:complete
MARKTAYSGGTLTVKLTESLTIDGRDYGGTSSSTFSSIKNVTRRIETITTTEATIITFDTVIGAGQYIPANIAYMRFTNLDDTNFVTLTLKNSANDEVAIKLDAGKTFVLAGDNSGGMASMMNAVAGDAGSDTALADLKDIQADANTGSCDIEIYIAGTA